jgi:hypothetical protein
LEWIEIYFILLDFPDIEDGDVTNTLKGMGARTDAPNAEDTVRTSLIDSLALIISPGGEDFAR